MNQISDTVIIKHMGLSEKDRSVSTPVIAKGKHKLDVGTELNLKQTSMYRAMVARTNYST